MTPTYFTLAVEDALSEAIARKMLEQVDRDYLVHQCLCKQGFGYLKKKIAAFNQAARSMPFFVLTDLDNPASCPPGLIHDWLQAPPHPNLVFRVAVVEVESWVMAHRSAFARFISVAEAKIPRDTDHIPDPKQKLIELAGQSRSRRIREDLVPQPGSTSKQGPDYNGQLSRFISEKWDVYAAQPHSNSLRHALAHLKRFKPIAG